MTTKQGCANEPLERDERPKILRYGDHARMIEQMIMDVLPDVIQKLGEMAKEGNVAAAKYLIDRIHGRPAKLATPAVADKTLHYRHQDWAADQVKHVARRDEQARIAMRWIRESDIKRQLDESARE